MANVQVTSLFQTSKFTTSHYGDTGLFFRHQDMADDLRIRPDWNIYTPQFTLVRKSPFRKSPCRGGYGNP